MNVDLTAEVKSLKSMIKSEVDDSVLIAELEKYVHRYRMDVEPAKRAIIKDHGGSDSDYIEPGTEPKHFADLVPGESNVTVIARVSNVKRKNTIVKGESRIIHDLFLEDDSGEVTLTIWEDGVNVETGHVYRFCGCRVSTYQGRLSLSLSRSGSYKLEDNYVIKSTEQRLRDYSIDICNIDHAEKGITLIGVILEIGPIQYLDRKTNQQKTRYRGKVSDGTGSIDFVAWSDPCVKPGDKVCMRNVDVDDWNGRISINVGRGTVLRL